MLSELAIPGEMVQILIKMQHNTMSGRTGNYANQRNAFFMIEHEYVVVIKKPSGYEIAYLLPQNHQCDIRDSATATWKDVVMTVVREFGKEVSNETLYNALKNHSKCKNNKNYEAKIRQTLQKLAASGVLFHTGKKKVVSFAHSFHGRTSAAVNITDNPKIIAPINHTFDVVYLALNDIDAVRRELSAGDVCAVVIEGIQGVGGIQLPDDEFLRRLRDICTETGTVLIVDEIQSGYGRSGKFFAHQYAGIRPDIITMAKGMGNGFPIGGLLISPMFTPVYGMLGTTFGGNHLACTAAIAVLDIMEKEALVDNAARVGTWLIEQLKQLPGIKEVRGRGLMIGIEFEESIKELRTSLLFDYKVFTGVAGTNVIRLLPPLTLTIDDAAEFMERFKKVLSKKQM